MSVGEYDFSTHFKVLPASCMVLDRNLCFVAANDKYLQTVGRQRADLIGRYVFDAFPESAERVALFKDAFLRALGGEENALLEVPFAIPLADGGVREVWWRCHHAPLPSRDGAIQHMIQQATDVTDEVELKRFRDAITGEMQHRVGNLLTLVGSIAKRTAANCSGLDEFQSKFQARLIALAKVNGQLTGENWNEVSLERILREHLGVFAADQVTIAGPKLVLTAQQAQAMSMAIHELATNASKHGALGTAGGRLTVGWKLRAADGFEFEWREDGLRDVREPASRGFGSLVLNSLLPAQLQGESEQEFSPTSHIYRLTVGTT